MHNGHANVYKGDICIACPQAAKKARDFLIRRLKRRLVLMERAEQQEAEAGQDKSGQQEEDAGK